MATSLCSGASNEDEKTAAPAAASDEPANRRSYVLALLLIATRLTTAICRSPHYLVTPGLSHCPAGMLMGARTRTSIQHR